jgi:hypothetical protein
MHGSQGLQIVHSEFANQETTGLADEAWRFHKKQMIKLALMILDDFSTVSSRTEGEGSAPQPTRIMAQDYDKT